MRIFHGPQISAATVDGVAIGNGGISRFKYPHPVSCLFTVEIGLGIGVQGVSSEAATQEVTFAAGHHINI